MPLKLVIQFVVYLERTVPRKIRINVQFFLEETWFIYTSYFHFEATGVLESQLSN